MILGANTAIGAIERTYKVGSAIAHDSFEQESDDEYCFKPKIRTVDPIRVRYGKIGK